MSRLGQLPARASLVVVTAGLSVPSSTRLLADRLASGTVSALAAVGTGATVEVVELREWATDLTSALLTGFPGPGLGSVLDRVVAADAVIAVSPIFNASYSGLFKTFVDVLEPAALAGTPVLIGATGGSARHSLALDHAMRPLFSYLRATVVPTAVYAAPEDWAPAQLRERTGKTAGAEGELAGRIARAANELARLVPTERAGVSPAPAVDEDDHEVVPFSQLLAAQRAAGAGSSR